MAEVYELEDQHGLRLNQWIFGDPGLVLSGPLPSSPQIGCNSHHRPAGLLIHSAQGWTESGFYFSFLRCIETTAVDDS